MAEGYSHIVLSPGPGRPDVARDVGRCTELLQVWNRPLLGVCLGHQCLVHQFQGKIERLDDVVHGRTDEIHHTGEGIFAGIPTGFRAMGYHSLVAAEPLPKSLIKTAWTESGIVMGVQHERLPYYGVQFHPESIVTQFGERLMRSFLSTKGEI